MAALNTGVTIEGDEKVKELFDTLKDTPLGDKLKAVVVERNKTIEDVRKIEIEPDVKVSGMVGNMVSLSFSGQAEYTIYFKDGWKKSFWYNVPVAVEE